MGVEHLLRIDSDKLSDDAAVTFARQLHDQVLEQLDQDAAPGGLLERARERGPAYARVAARLEREARSLRREVGHLVRLSATSKALRGEIKAVQERMSEHQRSKRALTTLPRRRRRRRRAPEESVPLTRLQAATRTRKGPGEVNEDAVLVDDALGFVAVVDGMGGPGAGDVAAATAIEALQATLPDLAEARADGREPERRELAEHLERLVDAVDRAVADQAAHADRSGVGVTAVLGLLVKDRLYLAHVGDARAYLRRRDRLRLLTEDHTAAQDAIEEGTLDPDAYEDHDDRTRLSRALGVPGTHARCDLAEVELADGDVLLFCTDGLPRTLSTDAIDQALAQGSTPTETADALQRELLASTLPDDVTHVVLHIGAPRGPDQADRVAAALSDAFLFRELSEAQRVAVARYLEPRRIETGEILVQDGEPADRMFIVAEGRLLVRKGRTRLTELSAGDHLGELALTRATHRSATVEAMATTLVYGLTREDFRKLCVRKPRLGLRLSMALIDVVGERLRDLTERVDRDRKARDLRRRISRSSS